MKFTKTQLLIISLILCLIFFLFPFLLKNSTETIFSTLSLSFTALQTIATIIALIIAINLYDRFGIESDFKLKQTNKVLELADLLKGNFFKVQYKNGGYFINLKKDFLKMIDELKTFEWDSEKIILISLNDFQNTFGEIIALKRSYWLPDSIKEKIKFLEFYGLNDVEDPADQKYVRYHFSNNIDNKEWMETMPTMTFREFTKNLYDLVESIEIWLEKNSSVKLNLKFEEEGQYKSNINDKK